MVILQMKERKCVCERDREKKKKKKKGIQREKRKNRRKKNKSARSLNTMPINYVRGRSISREETGRGERRMMGTSMAKTERKRVPGRQIRLCSWIHHLDEVWLTLGYRLRVSVLRTRGTEFNNH